MTGSQSPAMPVGERPGGAPLPAKLEPLVETARAYARAATSKNTNRAYPVFADSPVDNLILWRLVKSKCLK